MSIELTPHAEALIREKIAAGSHGSVDEVIEAALGALEEREQARLRRLRAMVRAGFESGEGIPFSQGLMDGIEREAEEAHRRGETPTVDICP